jgi:sugar-specific transcriptional regulator TrmB
MSLINDILIETGLNENESKVYLTLLDKGPLTILQLSREGNLKRTNLYNILTDLENRNLVKRDSVSKTKYIPNSPEEIRKLLDYKEQLLSHAKLNFEIMIDNLNSRYYLSENKPLINVKEGTDGLKYLYNDINNIGKDILLIRSHFDSTREDIKKMTASQIVAQVKRGIRAKVINPIKESQIKEAKTLYEKYDKPRLVEERFIIKPQIILPSQILIYSNKTSMTTIKERVITTIIDNYDITQTFRMLFSFMWDLATPQHNELVKDWKQEEI